MREAGTCDSSNQPLALVLMALGPEDVSRLRLGTLTEHSIGLLRLLRDFFGVTFQIDSEPDGSVLLTCRGVGFKNLSKRTT